MMNLRIMLRYGGLLFMVLCCSLLSSAQNTWTGAAGDGLWETDLNWSTGLSPVSADDVIIPIGVSINISDAQVIDINSLTFDSGSLTATSLYVLGTSTLNVAGDVTMGDPDDDAGDQTLSIGNGHLSCTNFIMPNTGANNQDLYLDFENGSITVSDDISLVSTNRHNIRCQNSGTGTITVGGTWTSGSFTRGNSTVVYNGAEQTIRNFSYHNLELSGGDKLLSNSSNIYGTLTLDALLDINSYQLRFISGSDWTTNIGYSSSVMIDISNGGYIRRDGNTSDQFENIFPIGTNGEYSPLEINTFSGTDVNGNLYIYLYDYQNQLTSGTNNSITRYWKIITSNFNLTNVSGSFIYSDNDVNSPIVETNLTSVGRFDGSDWQVNESVTAYDHTLNQITFDVADFSGDWTLGEGAGCFDNVPTETFSIRNGAWDSASTWNTGEVPAIGEDVIVHHAVYPTSSYATIHVNSLTIGEYGDLNTNQSDVTVDGDVIVNGILDDGNDNGGLFNIGGNLTINSGGDYNIQKGTLAVIGATSVFGTLRDTDGIGLSTFNGLLTVESGGTFTSNQNDFDFVGGIENHGSFTNTSNFTINQDLTISGSSEVLFSNDLFIADNVTLTNENNAGLVITDELNGDGANATLINKGWIKLADDRNEPMIIGIVDFSTNPNTVEYDRDGRQYLKATTYYNLIGSNNNDKELRGTTTVLNDLTTSGTADFECLGNDLILSGSVNHASSGEFTTGSNTVTYNGTVDQDILSIDYGGDLVIEGSGIKSLQSDISTVTGDITIQGSATLSLNGNTFSPSGNVTVATGAALDVDENSALQLADLATLTNNGILQVVGSSGNLATVSTSGSGGYLINQANASAEFHALYASFDGTGGITISDGTVDNTNNFSYTTFTNGTGTEYLNIDGLNNIGGLSAVQDVVFERSASIPSYNVTRTSGTGVVNFIAASGSFSGENYDNDDANPGTLITWSDPSAIYYSTGNVSAGLTTSWAHNQDGTGGNPSLAELTDGSLTLIVQDGHTVTLDSNGDINVKELIVGEGSSGTFNIGGDATQQTLTVQELIEVKTGATLQPGSAGEPAHILKLYGNLINNGTIDLRQSFTSLVNTEIYGDMVFSGSSTPIFSELSFKSGCKATADIALDVDWNLILESGATFNDGGFTHTVEYNWTNNGGTYNATGALEFDGGTSSITSGSTTTFNDVIFNGGGLATIKQAIVMNGDLLVNNNSKVSVDDVTVTVNGNYTVDTGSEYSQTANYTYFSGTDAQTITLDGTTSFYRIYFSNGGTNAKTIIGDLSVNNWLIINNGATVEGGGNHTISSGLRVDGTCNFSGEITLEGGYIDTNDASVNAITLGTAKIFVTGDVSLRHNVNSYTVDITANNDFHVKDNGRLFIFDDATLTGTGYTLTLDAGRNLYIRGADNFPDGFTTYDFNETANVVYDASIDQTVRGGFTYGRIYFQNANTKTVDGPLTITGHMYLRDDATLDLSTYSHTFSGSTIYNGAGENGSIDGTNATFTIGGADYNQTIQETGTGVYTFGNLILTQNSASSSRTQTFSSGCNVVVTGDLTINNVGGSEAIQHIVNLNDNGIGGPAGTFTLGENCQLNVDHLNFGADVIDNFTSTVFDINSTLYYTLDGGQPGSSSNPIDVAKNQNIADGVTYGNLWFYRGNKVAEGSLDIDGNIDRLSDCVFIDGGFTHYFSGNWELNNTNAYNETSATGTIIFDGADQDINGVNFNNIVISNSGSANLFNTLNIYGDITVSDGSSFSASTLSMNIGGDINVLGTGVYSQTSGTTTLNGDANQNITFSANSNFGYLTINKANSSSQTVTALSDIVISEDLTLTNLKGILDISNQTIYIGDDITIGYNTGVQNLITAGSTIVLNGTSAQYLTSRHEDALVLNNLTFEGSGDKTLQYSDPGSGIEASHNMEVNGTFTNNSSLVNGGSVVLYVRGDWDNTGTFTHSNTVYFDGADQDISSSSFYHVNFQGTDTKTLTGNISVSYDLYIDGTATLNADGNNITLGRHWYNEVATASYVHGNGKVVLNAAHGAYLYSGTTTGSTSGKTFYDIDINKSNSGYLSLRGDLVVENDFVINSNTLYTSSYDVWVAGNFDVLGTYNCNNNASLLTLNGSAGTYNFNPNSAVFRGLVIDANAATYNMQSDFTLQTVHMNINAGILNVNGNTIRVLNTNRKINIDGGTLNVGEGSSLVFTNTQSVELNSGELYLVGAEGNTSGLENEHADNPFSINAIGGTLYASNYRVQNGTINITGATLDATHNLSGGTFVEGDAGTSYITLTGVDLGTGISLTNMTFNAGADYNISRTSGSGVVSVTDAHGSMAGEYYEEDDGSPGTLIDWTFPAGFFWDGEDVTDNTDWNAPLNWSTNTVPGVDDIVYLDHSLESAAYTVNTNGDATCLRVNIDPDGGNDIELSVSAGNTLDVVEHVVVNTGATLTQNDNTAIINVGKSWTNLGTYVHNNSKVQFNAVSGDHIISSGGTGVGKAFYDIEINAGESNYTLDYPLDIDHNLTITSGTLDLSSAANDVSIAGDWYVDQSNGGSFVANSADVTFDGVAQTLTNGTFYNLIIEGGSTTTLASNIAVENNVTLNSGANLDAQDRNIYVRNDWYNNGGTLTQSGLGTVIFDAASGVTQVVDAGSSSTTFNNLTFSNGAGKELGNDVSVNGNVLINDGAGQVNLKTFVLNGVGSDNQLTCNEILRIEGLNNFPTGFETLDFLSTSTVRYYADIDQEIYPTSYGNLSLQRSTDGTDLPVKVATGDFEITGSLNFTDTDRPVELDMASNDVYLTLTGNIDLRGSSIISWGTGDATLEHIGGSWNIDLDIPSFNHLILSGTGDKYNSGDLDITGDLVIKSGISLRMYNGDRDDYTRITGTASGTISMETGAEIRNSRPSSDGVSIPEGFGTYDFNANSTYNLYSNGIDQTVYTGSDIAYGNLTFSNTKNVTGDGVANLDVNGNLNTNTCTYYDGGTDIEVAGEDIYFNRYVASSTDRTLILDGLRDQNLREDDNNLLDVASIQFSGTGVKTISDDATVTGNWLIDAGVTVQTNQDISFSGTSWTNNGYYQQTGSTLTFNGVTDQTIDPGLADPDNYFQSLIFDGASTKTFINNGADINNDFTINAGTVDLGSMTYYLADELVNTAGGTLLSSNASLVLDGAGQFIQTPDFNIYNIVCSGTGTKYLCSDWLVANDLTIESGATLDSRSTISSVTTDYDIYIGGDWLNEGTFTNRSKKVTFNGNISPTTITSGGSDFYDVEFAPTGSVNYTLLSESTSIKNELNVGADAGLNLNSTQLYLGRNTTALTHTVNGSLNINEGAFLYFNNDGSQATLDVYGALNIVGASSTNVATLSSTTTATNRDKTQVNIHSGATMAAKYYLIEYISDAGLNLMTGSTLHSTNNFSEGTFLGMRNQSGAQYLVLESDYSGGVISNISFSYSGVPTQGTHYSVERKLASTPITFDNVTGSVGSYRYEDDDEASPSYNSGLLLWPEITETTWTGAVNIDWHNDGNWDNGVPTATIDAIIPDRDIDPIIYADAECKSLIISTGVLRLEDDKDLVVHGDVYIDSGVFYVNSSGSTINVGGDWTINTHGNFSHGDASIIFDSSNGSVSISPNSSSFYNISFDNAITTFNLSGSDIDIEGDLIIFNGTVTPSTSNYTINLYGDYTIGAGSFDASINGDIILKSDADQTVTDGIFNNLIVDGSGNKNFVGDHVINGTTEVLSNLVAQSGSSITFNDDVTLDAGATFNDGGENHSFSGSNWYGYGAYVGSGTITFNKTTNNQYLYESTFNNLVVDCTSETFYLEGDVSILGDLTFKAGIQNANLGTNTITSDGTGTFTVESAVNVYVYGSNNFPKSFASYNLDATSTTRYYSASDQSIEGVSYGNLYFDHINTKTLLGDTEVKGNIIFNETTLDVSTNNYSLTVSGNWTNNNTAGGAFVSRSGEVIFNGSSTQYISIGDGNSNDFYNLTVDSSATVYANNSTNNDFIIANNLNVNSGTFSASGRTIYIGGDMLATGSGGFANSGLYYLNRSSGSASFGLNGSIINNVTINSGASYTVASDAIIRGSFILNSGTFDGNGYTIYIGNYTTDVVRIDGTYKVGPGGVLGLGNGTTCTVTASGRIEVVGSNAGVAKVSNNDSGGRYSFIVEGEIAAKYYMFEFMSNTGIYLTNTSTIDATNHFSEGTFSNGANSGQLFRIENTQSFTEGGGNRIENVSFPINPGGSATNVAKYEASTGDIEFYNSVGVFAGESFDNDPSNLIEWTGPINLTWNGSVDSDWNNVLNWTASYGLPMVPTNSNNVIIAGGLVNYPVLTNDGQKTGNLTIESGAEIRINTSAGDIDVDLDVDGDFIIDGALSTSTVVDLITVEGNWTAASGAVVILNGNVTFDGVGGAKQIDARNSDFYSLTISGSTQYQIALNTTVDNDLIINAGATLDANPSDYTITVNGDWINNGTFLAQQGTVVFESTTGPIEIYGGSSNFYDLKIDASGVNFNATSDVEVKNNLQLLNGTLDIETNTLFVGDGLGNGEISISGSLLIHEGATLDLASGVALHVNSGGSMELLGSDESNRAVLTSSDGGQYSFDVNSGGSIKAQYYSVDYIDADGLYMHPGANIDEVNNLSDGIFSNGTSGGSYMTLLHDMSTEDFTLRNIEFNAGPANSVTRTSGWTRFLFEDATGVLGNYLYERDEEASPSPSSGLLRWPFVNLYTWEGDEDSNWLTPGNWFDDQLPVSTSDVTIPVTTTNPIIDNSGLLEIHDLTIVSGATLTIEEGAQVTISGDVDTNDGLVIENSSDNPASVIIEGSIIGNTSVKWALTERRYWYIGHSVDEVNVDEYDASILTGDNDYFLYDYPGSWNDISKSSSILNNPLEGYSVIVKNANTVLEYSGILNNGFSYSHIVSDGRENLIANPYSSYIDLDVSGGIDFGGGQKSIWTRTDIGSGERGFAYYNVAGGTGLNGGTNEVATGQSFWVDGTGSSGLTLYSSTRFHGTSSLKSSSALKPNVIKVALESDYTRDETALVFKNIGTEAISNNDTQKGIATGKATNIYSLKGTNKVAISILPEIIGGERIPLAYSTEDLEGLSDYTLQFSGIESSCDGFDIYLADNKLGEIINLRENSAYTFTPETNVNTEETRFEIFFDGGLATDTENELGSASKVQIYAANSICYVNIAEALLRGGNDAVIQMFDVSGKKVTEFNSTDTENSFEIENQQEILIVRVIIGNYSYHQKIINTN